MSTNTEHPSTPRTEIISDVVSNEQYAPVKKKKKKKKGNTTYKSIMGSLTKPKEEEVKRLSFDTSTSNQRKQGLGGGNFSKLDKI